MNKIRSRTAIRLDLYISLINNKYFVSLDGSNYVIEEFGIDDYKFKNLQERIGRLVNKVMTNDKKPKAI